MDIFSRVEGFDWDKGNIRKSWDKHKVSPVECEEIFFNAPLVVKDDEAHSTKENRYYALGKTDGGRFLFVVFAIRGKKIRIISARNMSRKERRVYHEQEEAEKNTEI